MCYVEIHKKPVCLNLNADTYARLKIVREVRNIPVTRVVEDALKEYFYNHEDEFRCIEQHEPIIIEEDD